MQRYIDMILEDKQKIEQEMNDAMKPFQDRLAEADKALKSLGYTGDTTSSVTSISGDSDDFSDSDTGSSAANGAATGTNDSPAIFAH